MATDSELSLLDATADSINRKSGRYSFQKSASATSLSNRGTSSQLVKEFITAIAINPNALQNSQPSMRQHLVQLPLIKKSLLRFQRTGVNHPHLLPVRPIHAEDSNSAGGHPHIKKPGLHRKPRRIR